jgi:transcription elongation GreA/GreB family factor
MSRAFVKESDQDAGDAPPERAVSPHPNLVTPAGLQQIEARVRELDAELKSARGARDGAAVARVSRDLRYWTRRHASARVVEPRAAPDAVRFGVRVRLRFADGVEASYRLVGEDEADPARGIVSYVSPLAVELLGKTVGASVHVSGRPAEIVALE